MPDALAILSFDDALYILVTMMRVEVSRGLDLSLPRFNCVYQCLRVANCWFFQTVQRHSTSQISTASSLAAIFPYAFRPIKEHSRVCHVHSHVRLNGPPHPAISMLPGHLQVTTIVLIRFMIWSETWAFRAAEGLSD